jgi:uncharacterized integral membrane protein (TIGR00698 family)
MENNATVAMVDNKKSIAPGVCFCFALAVIAAFLGRQFPLIGGPVFAIIIGMIIRNTMGVPGFAGTGIAFTSKKILQWAIIALGGGLSLGQVWQAGAESFAVMVITLCSAFVAAFTLGRLFNIPWKLTSLIGTGTAICGGSAIAAVAPVIEADDTEVAYSISTIFLFNVIAVLIFPPIGHLLGFADSSFGLWAGTAINDTSSVVAAGYSYSQAAGEYATIVKLTRTTMIIPIAALFALFTALHKRRTNSGSGVAFSLKKLIPWFIVWFLVASLLNTAGIISGSGADYLTKLGKFMITMALAAVGLNADFRKFVKTGVKPLLLGLAVWFVVAVTSLIVQSLTGQL